MDATVLGLPIDPLPEGDIPLEAIVVCLTLEDGEKSIGLRYTAGISPWERIGMLQIAMDRARLETLGGWREEDEEDGEDE